MFKWLKSLFFKDKTIWPKDFKAEDVLKAIEKQQKADFDKFCENKAKQPRRTRLYKESTVVTTGELPKKPTLKKATTRSKEMATKPGLYANIHKKQERIAKEKAEGKPVEKMRKPGTKGAPTAAAFKAAAKTAKKK